MADDINNNEGMDEAGDAGMPDDLKRLLARAEQGEDGDPDSYNPDAEDEDDEDILELYGLDRDELDMMDEDERREALEEVGLDPDDYEEY